MSDLLRNTMKDGAPPRPRPTPSIPEHTTSADRPASDSSSSSTTSTHTLRAASPPPTTDWSNYFSHSLTLPSTDPPATYHVYLTPPTKPTAPLIICHHGAGSSALSFALLTTHLRHLLPTAGILSLSARGHGSHVPSPDDPAQPSRDYSIPTLTTDALTMIRLTQQSQSWPSLPPILLLGHSLGGAVLTSLAASSALGTSLIGYCTLDVVEGSALHALSHMKTLLASRPSTFPSLDDAIKYHTRHHTPSNPVSARITIPPLLIPTANGDYEFLTDLSATAPYWENWFTGLSNRFLTSKGAKLLVLAGTDRLDKELMVGQMQGKFQLVVLPEAGHFVHEDCPERVAEVVAEFWRRNDRGAMVLPPKVSELLAQGKKV